MATVTTTQTIAPRFTNWTNPSNQGGDQSGIPTGSVLFSSSLTIPAKGAADTNVTITNMPLPRNFVYRLETWNVSFRSTNTNGSVGTDLEKGLGCRVQLNLPGQGADLFFQTVCPAVQYGPSANATNPRFDIVFESATTLFGLIVYKRPSDYNDLLFDVADAATPGDMQLSLVDLSADATITGIFTVYVTFLQYTVDALNAWRLHTPTLINGSQ